MVNVSITTPAKRKAGGHVGVTSYARLAKSRKSSSMRAGYSKAAKPGITRAIGYYGRYPGAGGPIRGGELKFHDIDWNEASADFSAGVISNVSSLVLIGQGVTESLRIGRKLTIKAIGWRGKVLLETSSLAGAALGNTIRLILVLDSQCNGAAPAVSGNGGLLASANYQSFNNLVNKGRFTVLYDKTMTLNRTAGAGNGTANDFAGAQRNFSYYKKCDIAIEYAGVANPAVITELRTNNIFGIMIGSVAANGTSLDSKLRFRFSDS